MLKKIKALQNWNDVDWSIAGFEIISTFIVQKYIWTIAFEHIKYYIIQGGHFREQNENTFNVFYFVLLKFKSNIKNLNVGLISAIFE